MATFQVRSVGDASPSLGTPQALTTTSQAIIALFAQTGANVLCRGKIMEMHGGLYSDPAASNCNILYSVMRMTADGTGTAVTPNPEEIWETGTPPVARTLCKANYTSPPTMASGIWSLPLNQYSSFIWYSPTEKGLPWPAVAASGLVIRACGTTATANGLTVGVDAKFDE